MAQKHATAVSAQPHRAHDPRQNLAAGAFLQCIEAASLGMPFEVWKTRMARNRHEVSIHGVEDHD